MSRVRAAARAAAHHPGVTAGLAIAVVLVLAALLAPVIAPFPRDAGTATDLMATLRPPDALHPLGTDMAGRDVWSRILFGTWISVGASVVVVVEGASVVVGATVVVVVVGSAVVVVGAAVVVDWAVGRQGPS